MRKKIISLALALLLCLGLAVPAMAVDTSGLDANGAKAFYDTLSAYGDAVIHADLLDMNGDKSPELVVVSSPWPDGNGFNYNVATVDIWQLKSGQAAKTASVECDAGTFVGMNYISVDGAICLCASASSGRPGFHGIWETFVFAERWEFLSACWYDEPAGESENIADEINGVDFSRATNGGSVGAISREEYKAYIQKYRSASSVGDGFLSAGGQSWYLGEENAPSYQDVLTLLLAKLTSATPAPAAGTYGPYSITSVMYDGSFYTLSFSAAKVEERNVQLRYKTISAFGGPDEITPYYNKNIVFVTLHSGSNISDNGSGYPPEGSYVELDGNNQYTSYSMEFDYHVVDANTLKDDLKSNIIILESTDSVIYIIAYEDMYSAPATSGFIDVKSDAYYADAVQWAVDKEITAGTGANKFSPEQTCTVGQILTFLWRANGSPEPTGRNPFSDISTSDYFYKAAIWAYEKGLIPDTGSFELNSSTPCTRGMVAYFLWKLAGAPTSVSSGKYAPQTITVDDEGEYYLKFTAAAVEEVTVTERVPIYADDGNYTVGEEDIPAKVTLITMRPGSTVTVSNTLPLEWNMSNVIRGNAYSIGTDGKYHDLAWDIPLDMYTGAVENAFQYSTGSILGEYELPNVIELTSFDENRDVSQTYMLQIAPVPTKFSDVSAHDAHAQAIAWAVENEITGGTGNGQFSPNSTCTRGQIVTFLYRAMGQ